MSDIVERWTLGCYAPGNYHCICSKCSQQFIGDKRAVTCLPCAGKEAAAELTNLRAEVERLRAALAEHACKCSVKGEGAGGNCTRGTGECSSWTARAALAQEKKG